MHTLFSKDVEAVYGVAELDFASELQVPTPSLCLGSTIGLGLYMPAGIPSRASAPIYDITRRARKREPVNKEHNDSMSWSASEASATNKLHRHLFDQVKEVNTSKTKTGNQLPTFKLTSENGQSIAHFGHHAQRRSLTNDTACDVPYCRITSLRRLQSFLREKSVRDFLLIELSF